MSPRALRTLALGAVLVGALGACGDDDDKRYPTAADLETDDLEVTQVIEVDEDGFDPDEVTVAAGDLVRLVNTGEEPHSFASDSRLDTGEMEPGDELDFIFEDPSTITYRDRVGDTSNGGTIIVTAAPAESEP